MKMKLWTVLVAMISMSLVADQPAAPASAAAPMEASSQPAQRTAPAELKTVPLVPGPAIVSANRVNVRGQARLRSEVIARLTNGQPVTVIEEIQLKRSGPDEPSAWAKIALPPSAHVWVHGAYIDKTNMTVLPNKLNLRAGPGENYSIIGSLQRGDSVQQLQMKGEWMEVEPPANAYAFVAAQYLVQASEVPAEPAPVVTETVTETPEVATTVTETPTETAIATNEVPAEMPSEEPVVTEAPEVEEQLPPRIVLREGIVRGTYSIQAPTQYQLVSPDNYKSMNYLYTTSTNLDLSRYKGLRIIVTGEESLDKRWKNTPIITIQRIQVLE